MFITRKREDHDLFRGKMGMSVLFLHLNFELLPLVERKDYTTTRRLSRLIR